MKPIARTLYVAAGTFCLVLAVVGVVLPIMPTVPFLLLFVLGYWYTGLMSLLQGRFEGWRGRKTPISDHTKPFPVGV